MNSFVASGLGRLAVIGESMNFILYQKVLQENVWSSDHALKLKAGLGLCSRTIIENTPTSTQLNG